METVLVIGARPEQANALAFRLGILGFEAVPSARELKLALRVLVAHKVSIVLLDVDASVASRRFFSQLREFCEMPIVAFGEGRAPADVIWYLEEGAADYVAKNISPRVLAARVGAILRTSEAPKAKGRFDLGNVTVDLDARTVVRDGRPVSLTRTEYRVLEALIARLGKACSHGMLLEQVWGADFQDCSHYLRIYIGYLRQKLESDPRRPRLIMTEWGSGYRLAAPALDGASRARKGLKWVKPASSGS